MPGTHATHVQKQAILTTLTELEEVVRPVFDVSPVDFVQAVRRIYVFFNDDTVMRAVFDDLLQNYDKAVQRINDHPTTAHELDRITVVYGFFDQISRGTEDLIQYGVTVWRESDYDRIVKRARLWLTQLLDSVVSHLRQVCLNLEDNEEVPTVWLSLSPPDHTVKGQVEHILRDIVEARSDDKRLIYEFLRKFYGIKLDERIFDPKVPSFETIRRSRQLVQREGKFGSGLKQTNLWDE